MRLKLSFLPVVSCLCLLAPVLLLVQLIGKPQTNEIWWYILCFVKVYCDVIFFLHRPPSPVSVRFSHKSLSTPLPTVILYFFYHIFISVSFCLSTLTPPPPFLPPPSAVLACGPLPRSPAVAAFPPCHPLPPLPFSPRPLQPSFLLY